VKHDWIPLSAEEVEAKIVELANKGVSKSQIGLILRDQFAVPLVKIVTGKSISQILEENQITSPLPEDLVYLARKALEIRKHLENNKKDLEAKKGLNRTESKIYRLVSYYKKRGVLPPEFKYRPETIKIMLR
jgi:small subunit ribosomal protein S15